MTRLIALSPLMLMFTFSCEGVAGEPPPPRTPIGPRASEMFPSNASLGQISKSIANDSIRVQNVGDQRLFLSYWNGENSWESVSIGAGQSSDILCAKCAGTVVVAYHDGKTDRTVKAKAGNFYLLGWSEQTGAWVLTASTAK